MLSHSSICETWGFYEWKTFEHIRNNVVYEIAEVTTFQLLFNPQHIRDITRIDFPALRITLVHYRC